MRLAALNPLRPSIWMIVAGGFCAALAPSGCARGGGPPDTEQIAAALTVNSVLQVAPPIAAVPATVRVQFYATLLRPGARPRNLSAAAVWSVSDASVASVDDSGLVTALHPGTAKIIATYQKISASAAIIVTPATLVSVAVTPPFRKIHSGSHAQFTATGTFSDGRTFL